MTESHGYRLESGGGGGVPLLHLLEAGAAQVGALRHLRLGEVVLLAKFLQCHTSIVYQG